MRFVSKRQWTLAAACVCLWSVTATAQEKPPRFDVYGGVSYANLSLPGLSDRQHSVGWGASFTTNLTRRFGVTIDLAGQYKPKCADNDVECLLNQLLSTQFTSYSSHQFLAGPRATFPGRRFNGFAHALFGGARTRVSILDLTTGERSKIVSGPNFAMGFGGGLDWKFHERAAIRLVQVDYIPVKDAPTWRHNVRIQGGIVVRF